MLAAGGRRVARLGLRRHRVSVPVRRMGFFDNLKNQMKEEMEKNEDLKKSWEELEAKKQQFKQAETAAKAKVQEASQKTSEAARNAQEQASEKFKQTVSSTTSEEEAKDSDKEEAKDGSEEKTKEKQSWRQEEEKSAFSEARQYVSGFWSSFQAQKNKIIKPQVTQKWRSEWGDAVQELFGSNKKGSVDEALQSSRPAVPQTTKKDEEEAEAYEGPTALVKVKEDDTAWQRISARFREAPIIQGILDAAKTAAKTDAGQRVGQTAQKAKEKVGDAREEVLEFWETSQNPWVYRLSSIYDGLFGETAMAVAIREIRRAEPDFILEEWKENIEAVVLPGVLEAFLKGDTRNLQKWFGEAAFSRLNMAIRERKADGLVMDPHVLSIDNVDVIEATAEDRQAPIILLRFQAQQINCIRNREGEIVDGAEDEVLAYYYIFAFQRDYDDENETLRWKIVDIHMQRGGRYY